MEDIALDHFLRYENRSLFLLHFLRTDVAPRSLCKQSTIKAACVNGQDADSPEIVAIRDDQPLADSQPDNKGRRHPGGA
jgi:hypothetical protein